MFEQRPQLAYDNLYKFYVSFGIAIIVVPLLISACIFISTPEIISQIEYDCLSKYTLNVLNIKSNAYVHWVQLFPAIQICASFTGIILIWIGIDRWGERQNVKDRIEDKGLSDTENPNDVDNKINKKLNDGIEDDKSHIVQETKLDCKNKREELIQYRRIEYYAYEWICVRLRKRYIVKRNQRFNNIMLDCVAVSTEGRSDIIFELLYVNKASTILEKLSYACAKVLSNTREYKEVFHKQVHATLLVVVPKNEIQNAKSIVFASTCAAPSLYDIQIISEEELINNGLCK